MTTPPPPIPSYPPDEAQKGPSGVPTAPGPDAGGSPMVADFLSPEVPATGTGTSSGMVKRESAGTRPYIEWAIIIAIALVFAIVVRTFVASSYYIPSASMLPTLNCGDRIVVDKLAYDFQSVRRGDIVVFTRPNDPQVSPTDKDLVKRVIGLPGDTISLSGGHVYIDGNLLAEPYLPATVSGAGCPNTPSAQETTNPVTPEPPSRAAYDLSTPYKVPAGDYFVMGDNRENSLDSRYFGPIPSSSIVGKATLRYWPMSRLHLF